MSFIVTPPPIIVPSTNQKNRSIYTVKKSNVPVTLRIRDRTTLMTFKEVSDATTIASSFESHYIFTKSWPDMTAEAFQLTKGPFMGPNILDIFQEDFDDIREYCALWNISLLIVDNLKIHNGESILFSGDLLTFEVSQDDYLNHLENIMSQE